MDKFLNYFDERHRASMRNKPVAEAGPVITLSRLTGCDARQIAAILVDDLNRKYGTNKWRWVDKDIIYAIAKELNTDSLRVENFYKGIELSNLSEMIMAFSGGFVSDLRIKKAIKDVVLSMCKDGYIVLVGRGGVSIAQEINDALHIRIIAPFYWRVANIMKKLNMEIDVAEEYIVERDQGRFNLILAFLDKKPVNIDYLFDATINRKSYSIQEVSDIILSMYDKKVSKQMTERKKETGI